MCLSVSLQLWPVLPHKCLFLLVLKQQPLNTIQEANNLKERIYNNVLNSSNCYASTVFPTDSTDQNDSRMAAKTQVTLTPVDPSSTRHGGAQLTF
jgi:hypothetical protein